MKKIIVLAIVMAMFSMNSVFAQSSDPYSISVIDVSSNNQFDQEITVTKSIVRGDINQYFADLRAKGTNLSELSTSKATNPNQISTNSVTLGSSNYGGNGCSTASNGKLTGCIYANGKVELLSGGLTGAKLTYNTIAQTTQQTGAGFTNLQAQSQIDWTLYGIVGGSSVVVTSYNIKSAWYSGIVTFNGIKNSSGIIAYSSLSIYGNHKATNGTSLVQFNSVANLTPQ